MNMESLIPRQIKPRIAEALIDTPVVLLAGPRQAGKTTLVRQIAEQQGLRYLTMDDALTLLSAQEDPVGMIRSLDRAVIDEIQRAPQLLIAITEPASITWNKSYGIAVWATGNNEVDCEETG